MNKWRYTKPKKKVWWVMALLDVGTFLFIILLIYQLTQGG